MSLEYEVRSARTTKQAGGKFLNRNHNAAGQISLLGAPKQYQYRPPTITVPKRKPVKPAEDCDANNEHNRLNHEAALARRSERAEAHALYLESTAKPKRCDICLLEFPTRKAWGRHHSECGRIFDKEPAD